MTAASVLTVILNYRTAAMTLRSLAAARIAMQGLSGEIVVVDNASGDGSFQAILAHVTENGWRDVRVLASGHNGGFGAGNNIGIRAGFADGSRPDYVYVLNSDAFPAPDAIRALRDHLEANPGTAFAGSHIHGEDGVTHLTTFRFPSIASEVEGAIKLGLVTRVLGRHAVPRAMTETGPVDWLAGASLMMRRRVLDAVGLFDETFFLYFEETELCHRVRQAGHDIAFVRESEVMHIGSVSTGMKTWARVPGYWFDSRLHYFTKVHGGGYAVLATLAHLAGGGLNRLRCRVTGRIDPTPPHFLRSLVAHHLAALMQPARKASAPLPQTGE